MTRQFSAGGTVFKRDGERVFWLIIKPKPSPDFPTERYQLPKGLIEVGEKPEEAAVREVREETGVESQTLQKIDTTKYVITFKETNLYPDNKIFKIVTWYLMAYLGGQAKADGTETEEVMWLPTEEALKKLSFSSERATLKKAMTLVPVS